jgi:hypothetical protein
MEMKNYIKNLTVLSGAILMISMPAGCGDKEAKTEKEKSTESLGMGIGGGLSWAIPQGWSAGPTKSMRIDTYIIDAEGDDTDSAECAVFHFGSTSGGGIEANLLRWAGQFEQPDGGNSMEKADIDSLSVNGLNVVTIDLTGDYLVSGAMMQVTGKKTGYRLLGAIVEGPQGSVFFKLTGPENTVKSAKDGFDALLQSIKPKLI